MRILNVVPIIRGGWSETLTYFSKDDITEGSIVSVPLRKKLVPALVISSRDVNEVKTEIKAADFAMKKVAAVLSTDLLLPQFVQAAKQAANYFVSPLGLVLEHLIPKAILANSNWPKIKVGTKNNKTAPAQLRPKNEHCVLQEPDEERLSFYKSLIREAFARNTSVFFTLPTIANLESALPILEKGISQFTFVFHSKLSQKELVERWRTALNTKHPVLIIATPLFLSLPRTDIKTIIVDRENTTAYQGRERPYLDFRIFADFLANSLGAKIIYGDLALRTETIFKTEKDELLPLAPIKYRALTDLKQEVINASAEKPADDLWPALSLRLTELLDQSLNRGEKVFLLAGRRGLAPTTICQDCGAIKSCPHCEAPLVLHGAGKTTVINLKENPLNVFRCHRCGYKEEAKNQCRVCGGWRLRVLGIGVESLERWWKKHRPKVPLFRIDSDQTTTSRQAQKVAEQFSRTPGSLLIGTEMALSYLKDKVEVSAVAGVDSFLSLPDFRINEKLLVLLLRTRHLASKKFYLETRQPTNKIFDYALTGNLLDFYRDELAERKEFNWPPFSQIIKVSIEGKPEHTLALANEIEPRLKSFEPHRLTLPSANSRYNREILIIIRSAEAWPDQELLRILQQLPPSVVTTINPEDLF